MYKIPKDKEALHVLISKEVMRKFREIVKMKHENLRGALSYEVEQALQAWIAAHTKGTQILASKANPQPRTVRVWEQVKQFLKERYGYAGLVTGVQIPKAHVIEAIACLRGDDRRTIDGWLERFQKYKLLKPISPNVFEVI
jgi:hypothetical protein